MVQPVSPTFIPTRSQYGETTYINPFAIREIKPITNNTSRLVYSEGGKDYFTTASNSDIKISTGLDVNA